MKFKSLCNKKNLNLNFNLRRLFSVKLNDFAVYKTKSNGHVLQNFYNGKWQEKSEEYEVFPNPLTGVKDFVKVPNLTPNEFKPVVEEMRKVPTYGLHNPLKNNERYLMYGQICRKLAQALYEEDIFNHFVDLIKDVAPKSTGQAVGEMKVIRAFIENFAGDNVRYLARGFSTPGDHQGQSPSGLRFPYGPVSVITPFNFPLEIMILQTMGALFMGNKPLIKNDSKVALPMNDFLRLMHACGMPKDDVVMIHSDGKRMEELMLQCNLKMNLFTGSARAAKRLTNVLNGKIKVEDAGLDWKILGPDVSNVDYVSFMIDHDSYALGGQKCSAESFLFVHENWTKTDLYSKIKALTEKRSINDLTNPPILSWNNKKIQAHIDNVLKTVKGSEILFGGKPITEKHSVPEIYGTFQPTAIKVPIESLTNPNCQEILNTELFGPFQLVVEYKDSNLNTVIDFLNNMEHKLTCGVVSNDVKFLNKVLGETSNGTTYAGIRARTTGAPQNHWFGPGGDPRAGGIGSIESIQLVWSHHREIVYDYIIPDNINLVQS